MASSIDQGFDAYFMLSPDGKQAYYAASRTPNGPADLFRATASGVAPPDTTPPPAVVPNVAQRALLRGRVLDAKTRQPVVAEPP